MDLWIRSQDKKHLIRATNIDIAFNGKIFVNEVQFDNDLCVGNYLGEERALEVLDEIQEHISCLITYKDRTIYQMPKE